MAGEEKKSGLAAFNSSAVELDRIEQGFFDTMKRYLLEEFVAGWENYRVIGVLLPVKVLYRNKETEFDWWSPILCFVAGVDNVIALIWQDGEVVRVDDVYISSSEVVIPGQDGFDDIRFGLAHADLSLYRSTRDGELAEKFCYRSVHLIDRMRKAGLMEKFYVGDESWFRKLIEVGLKDMPTEVEEE